MKAVDHDALEVPRCDTAHVAFPMRGTDCTEELVAEILGCGVQVAANKRDLEALDGTAFVVRNATTTLQLKSSFFWTAEGGYLRGGDPFALDGRFYALLDRVLALAEVPGHLTRFDVCTHFAEQEPRNLALSFTEDRHFSLFRGRASYDLDFNGDGTANVTVGSGQTKHRLYRKDVEAKYRAASGDLKSQVVLEWLRVCGVDEGCVRSEFQMASDGVMKLLSILAANRQLRPEHALKLFGELNPVRRAPEGSRLDVSMEEKRGWPIDPLWERLCRFDVDATHPLASVAAKIPTKLRWQLTKANHRSSMIRLAKSYVLNGLDLFDLLDDFGRSRRGLLLEVAKEAVAFDTSIYAHSGQPSVQVTELLLRNARLALERLGGCAGGIDDLAKQVVETGRLAELRQATFDRPTAREARRSFEWAVFVLLDAAFFAAAARRGALLSADENEAEAARAFQLLVPVLLT